MTSTVVCNRCGGRSEVACGCGGLFTGTYDAEGLAKALDEVLDAFAAGNTTMNDRQYRAARRAWAVLRAHYLQEPASNGRETA